MNDPNRIADELLGVSADDAWLSEVLVYLHGLLVGADAGGIWTWVVTAVGVIGYPRVYELLRDLRDGPVDAATVWDVGVRLRDALPSDEVIVESLRQQFAYARAHAGAVEFVPRDPALDDAVIAKAVEYLRTQGPP